MDDATAHAPAGQATTTSTVPAAASRRDAIAAIRDQAIVCRRVGIAAILRRLPDGRHQITHRGRNWTAATLDEAIDAATRRGTR